METKYGYQKLDLEYLLDEVETKHGYQKIDLAYLSETWFSLPLRNLI